MPITELEVHATLKVQSDLVFDGSNDNFVKTFEHNEYFIRGQQNMYNDLLRYQGYVFLNDVLKALGFPRSAAGAIVGWTYPRDYVELKILGVKSQGDACSSILIQHNATTNVLDFMEGR